MSTRHRITASLVVAVLGSSILLAQPVVASESPQPVVSKAVTKRFNTCPTSLIATGTRNYIVRFADNATQTDVNRLVALKNGKIVENRRFTRAFNGAVVELTPRAARDLCLLEDASLQWVEEDQTFSVAPVTASVYAMNTVTANSWGLDRIDQRTGTNGTYSYTTTGSGVDIYIVDTGILATHNQFGARVSAGFSAVADSVGTSDCNGHGTHVAGTAAGSTLGVAPAANLIPVRVLDCNGSGTVSGVIAGIEWAIGHHTTTPAVMNLSLGAGKSDSLNAAIDRAFLDGITVVAAAGNSNVDACTVSPASNVNSALTVGATTTTDARATYSNFGACLDLFAPGSGITSAWHTSNTATNTISGTSMAAPHVAGLAARYLSVATTAVPSQVMDAVKNSSTPNVVTSAGTLSPNRLAYGDPAAIPETPPLMTPNNPDASTGPPGSGTSQAPTVPGAPARPKALSGLTSSWLDWVDAPTGGLPITGHVVQIYRKNTLVGRVVVDADEYHTIGNLRAASSHTFAVAAMNAVGIGPFSERSNTIIPLRATRSVTAPQGSSTTGTAPARPTRVRATQVRSSVDVSWTIPTNAVVENYEVLFIQRNRVVAKAITASVAGVRIFGLKRGTYAVRVRAVNTAGSSPRSQFTRLVFR
jgi:subtilisin family serine protease